MPSAWHIIFFNRTNSHRKLCEQTFICPWYWRLSASWDSIEGILKSNRFDFTFHKYANCVYNLISVELTRNRCSLISSIGTFTLSLFSARLMTVTGNFRLFSLADLRVSVQSLQTKEKCCAFVNILTRMAYYPCQCTCRRSSVCLLYDALVSPCHLVWRCYRIFNLV